MMRFVLQEEWRQCLIQAGNHDAFMQSKVDTVK